VIADGADIIVEALTLVEGQVVTPLFPQAAIFRAGVAIIATLFVDSPRAVVVQAVTNLFCWLQRVTGGQPLLRANPLAATDAKFARQLTGRPEGECHRLRRTRADPSVSNTLLGGKPIYGNRFVTREPPRTVLIRRASPAAKKTFDAVVDTDVLGPGNALATLPRTTRTAEIGVVGNADINQIRLRCPNRLATPARRALLAATLAADPGPHVVNTPARQTIRILVTRVEEAPFTGSARYKDLIFGVRAQVDEGQLQSIFMSGSIGLFYLDLTVS